MLHTICGLPQNGCPLFLCPRILTEELPDETPAGGISTVEDIEKFLDLGADRLGTSRAVKLLTSGEAGSGY